MPKPTLALKATVTRRQAAEPVDQAERQLQAEHHQAVTAGASTGAELVQGLDSDKAHQTAGDAATVIEPEKSGKDLKPAPHALQAAFLTENLGKPITVFTINGLRLTGKLRQFDQFTLLLGNADGTDSLIFKHAITTVMPASEAPGKQLQPNKN